MLEPHYLVPDQLTGVQKDLSVSVAVDGIDDADDAFVAAKDRLLDVNMWHKYVDLSFLLTDAAGKPVLRHAHKGDNVGINVPGTGHAAAIVNAIEYDDYPDDNLETFALRLIPPPSHADDASATLVIERKGSLLMAHYHARNENGGSVTGKWSAITDEQWLRLLSGLISLG